MQKSHLLEFTMALTQVRPCLLITEGTWSIYYYYYFFVIFFHNKVIPILSYPNKEKKILTIRQSHSI
jgi:hypothetical protein